LIENQQHNDVALCTRYADRWHCLGPTLSAHPQCLCSWPGVHASHDITHKPRVPRSIRDTAPISAMTGNVSPLTHFLFTRRRWGIVPRTLSYSV
jgi:hypothetical protein